MSEQYFYNWATTTTTTSNSSVYYTSLDDLQLYKDRLYVHRDIVYEWEIMKKCYKNLNKNIKVL